VILSATHIPRSPTLMRRVTDRLATLGLATVCVDAEGRVHASERNQPIERLICESSLFRAVVRNKWESIHREVVAPVALWDGLWLVPLMPRRRRRERGVERGPTWAVLLSGTSLLHSEQMQAICREFELDHRATIARFDASRMVTACEAQRLASMLAWMLEDVSDADRHGTDTQKLSRELTESYEELSLLYRLSTSVTVDQSPVSFLTSACRELQQVVGLDWLAIRLIDNEPRLADLGGRLFSAGTLTGLTEECELVGRAVLERFATQTEPRVFDCVEELGVPELSRLSPDLLVVPLHCDGRTIGVLLGGGGSKRGDGQITSGDSKLCASLAGTIAIFLQNMMLYEDVQSMFLGTLHALTSAIDAKDSYTHGHSERVAMLSRMLAQHAGLDTHTADRVYLAGLVHDVGKIGVPEAVLGKAGRLTDREFALIKLHPQIGAGILGDIPQMRDLIPGVLHHHEKWNGSGYPHGLAGQDIPLFGRLIGLADAFDAMSSTRTYRHAMPLDHVLAEIERCSGTQFDPDLAGCFVHLDFEPFDRLIDKHRQEAPPTIEPADG
jgi:HD-GYP domain-containing protein (c-di-GMP phosphodiesterase class II)